MTTTQITTADAERFDAAESLYGESITKFHDEFSAYLWGLMLDGLGEPTTFDESTLLFELDAVERKRYGVNATEVMLWTSVQGFVYWLPVIN